MLHITIMASAFVLNTVTPHVLKMSCLGLIRVSIAFKQKQPSFDCLFMSVCCNRKKKNMEMKLLLFPKQVFINSMSPVQSESHCIGFYSLLP